MEKMDNNEGLSAKRRKLAENESVMPSLETIRSARSLVQQNDLDGLRSLLGSCSPQERRAIFRNAQLQSSLHVAFSHGNRALLIYLLQECRVDVDHREEEQGVTVLHRAVEAGDVVTTGLLLDFSAQVNFAEDNSGTQGCSHKSILREALSTGNPEVFRMLLNAGLKLKMWSRPKTSWPVRFRKDSFDDLVRCAMDFGLCTKENQELLGHFLEAAVTEGSQAFDVLWPYRPPGTDDFRLATLALLRPSSRYETFHRIFWKGSLSPSQRADLLEYCGAWSILFEGDYSFGLSVWERAMRQRWKNPDQPLMKKSAPYSVADFHDITEVQTLQELHDMDQSPDHLNLQAACVIERVHEDGAWYGHIFRANMMFQEGRYKLALSLLSRAVERGKSCEEPCSFVLVAYKMYRAILTSGLTFPDGLNFFKPGLYLLELLLHCLEKCFHQMVEQSGRSRHDVVVPGKFSCTKCLTLWWLECTFCQTTELLLSVKSMAGEDDLEELKKQLVSFIRLDPRLGRRTRLHVASLENLGSEAIQLLVECSAEVGGPTEEVNSAAHLFADRQGNRPLHILAEKMTPTQLLDEGTVSCFLKHGAHLCARGKSGRRVLDILESRGIHVPNSRPLSLKCVAARVMRREQDKGVLNTDMLPNHLKHFLLDH